MDMLVSKALTHPAVDSTLRSGSLTSASKNIRAFSSRRAGLFPFRINASSRSRSSALNRVTATALP